MGRSNPSANLQQALDYEQQFVARLLNDENGTLRAETMHCIQQRASAGQLNSPSTKTELLNIECRCLKRIISGVIVKRLELAADTPEIVSPKHLDSLHRQVGQMIETRFRGIIPNIARATGHVRYESTYSEDDGSLEDDKMRLLAWARQELEFSVSEFRLRESRKTMANETEEAEKAEVEQAPSETGTRGWKQPAVIVVLIAAVIGAMATMLTGFITNWDKLFPPEAVPPVATPGTQTPDIGDATRTREGTEQTATKVKVADENHKLSPENRDHADIALAQTEASIAFGAESFSHMSMDEFFSTQYSGTDLQTDEFERQMIGKTIIWTGQVRSVYSGENEGVKVVAKPIRAYGSAFLEFDASQKKELLAVGEGQTIRFTGIIRSIVANPFIDSCRLLAVIE